MRLRMKVAVAMGFFGAVAVAATAFGQTGTPTPGRGEQRKLERRANQDRGECGKGGRPAARAARRLVHSEAKVRAKDGFAVVVVDIGTIKAVNAGAKSVTIERADGETVTVTANDQTKVCRNGAKVTFDQLSAGDTAGINRVTRNGETRVRAIRAHTPGSEPAAGTQKRPAAGTQKRPAAGNEDFLGELSA